MMVVFIRDLIVKRISIALRARKSIACRCRQPHHDSCQRLRLKPQLRPLAQQRLRQLAKRMGGNEFYILGYFFLFEICPKMLDSLPPFTQLEAEAEASVEAARSAAAASVSKANGGNEFYILGYFLSKICPEI